MLNRAISFVNRLVSTARLMRKVWRDGGVATHRISNIQRGEILRGKRILVTGGGSGIGLAIARKCLEEGAIVVITGRNEAKLASAAQFLGNERLHTLKWDVADISIHADQLAEAETAGGGIIDILVNNAGILLDQSFFSTSEALWDSTYATNSKGAFFLTQLLSQMWISNRIKGKILNVSSSGGILGATYPYRMTKWDMIGLTEGLGMHLSPHGIIVNGIAPGRISTGMLGQDDQSNIYDDKQPLARFGLPEEIAELAVFLMSDAANYIVGQTIVCDGGYTLKI